LKQNSLTKAQIVTIRELTPGSESELTDAIAKVGPISIAIDASMWEFQHWKGEGVFTGVSGGVVACSRTDLNHAVNAIGYGTTSGGIDYYLVRNSYGPEWGN
jgi:hypothetical protein